jgi:RNA polymerase sigma-70 factor, ECF subfamily
LTAAATKIREYITVGMELDDQVITKLLIEKDEAAFEQVFKKHFKGLHGYAFAILKDAEDAEEMVQQVFLKLWEKAERLNFSGSVAAYLYRSVHNACLNYIKHQKVKHNHQLYVAYSMKNEVGQTGNRTVTKELEKKFDEALNDLPEQCRTIFQLSRFEGLKYREIADQLDISIKTVENQMGKALKLLRVKLVDFLPLLFIFLHF